MPGTDLLYLSARLVMAALCLAAAAVALRRMVEPEAPTVRPRRLLGLLVLVLVVGAVESGIDAWWQLVRFAGHPVTAASWLWLLFDCAVPLLALLLLRVMRQRDRALEQLAALSMTDPLTGLANRRGFEARARAAVEAAQAAGQPCCIAALDLDHFKTINDAHGHPAGDAVLREVAETLARFLRAEDVLGRLGGEEFAVLLAATTPREAALLAERLRAAVRVQVGHPAGRDSAVTLSAGIAQVAVGGSPAAALMTALAAADAALYAAKAGGRDRVELGVPGQRRGCGDGEQPRAAA